MHLASSDLRVDISLNLLTLVVAGAIALALLWQLVILLDRPARPDVPAMLYSAATAFDDAGPPSWAAEVESQVPARDSANPPLSLPRGSVFRCNASGRITYSDRPCDRGEVRVLRLPGR
jgi:hypothetical protein